MINGLYGADPRSDIPKFPLNWITISISTGSWYSSEGSVFINPETSKSVWVSSKSAITALVWPASVPLPFNVKVLPESSWPETDKTVEWFTGNSTANPFKNPAPDALIIYFPSISNFS